MGGLLETLANYNPSGFATANQQAEANLAHTQAQVPLIQAKTTAQQAGAARTQLENQEIQRQIDAAKKMADLYRNPAVIVDEYGGSGQPRALPSVNTSIGTFLKAGYTYPEAVFFATKAVEYGKNALSLTNEQRKSAQDLNDLVGQHIASVESLPVEQRGAAWAQVAPQLSEMDRSVNWGSVDPTNTAQLEQLKASHLLHSTILGWAKTGAETHNLESEANQKKAQAALEAAQTPGAQAESTIKQGQAEAMKSLTPEAIQGMVSKRIDPQKYPDQYAHAVNAASDALRLGLGTQGVQAAIKDFEDKIQSRENAIEQARVTSIPFREAALQNQQFQRTQQSYQFHAAELDKLATPVTQLQERIQRLNDTIAQGTPQADALVAPELLSVMSGGQGSGLRMNEAEISRIVGGRSKWETLKAAINQWSLDPSKANSITPEQRQEVHALVDTVTQRANERQALLNQARSSLAGATGPEQHRVILSDTIKKLGETNSAAPHQSALPEITSQAEFDKLPSGAIYTENGHQFRKP